MNQEQKQYVERNIHLIDNDDWDKFFLDAPEGTGEALYIAGIDFMSIMGKVPPRCFYRSSLRNITISNNVTSIGKWAFSYCSNLTSVTIPDSVTSIGYEAFYGCESLTGVTISDSVTSIGSYAFCNCHSLTSFTIPNNVTSIGEGAFFNCLNLKSVTISDGVTSIGKWAFKGCSNLTSVVIPNSVTSIGEGAFTALSSDAILINFNGTKEQWKKIYNSEAFKDTYFTVNCLDGTLHKKKG